MKLAYRAYAVTLLLITLAFAVSAQNDKNARSAKDPRNTTSTVGTGGPVGGPTGLFTVYDGQTLRKGEYTFSAAYSNFDRDPGNVDITEVPLSFQIGLTNNIELFFNTDGYRAIKVNSPRNLSSFYLPNSRLQIGGFATSGPAIILAPQGSGAGAFIGQAIYRPTGTQFFVQYPFIGGQAGQLPGFPFGFTTPFATMGPPRAAGNGADNFPGIGSVYGSILPGVVLQTSSVAGGGTIPTVFATAPSYLPDAPFINRTYGESSFSTFTVGGKFRFNNVNDRVGYGVVAFYRFFADKADDFSGFNQLQRGASPGGNRGDIGVIAFADARLRKWLNLSGNIGYVYNSSVKGDLGGGSFTLLDRPDEIQASIGADFPANKYFQPILEFRTQQYVGGRTPNAFENSPMDGIAGARIYPTRWISLGAAYRYNFNQQDRDSFDDKDSFTSSVTIVCPVGQTSCVPQTVSTSIRGVPAGFQTSSDPHGYIFQATVGRRNKRAAEVVNQPANVTALTLSDSEINLPCPAGFQSTSGACNDSTSISVSTTAVDPENDVLTYNYTVSGGRVVGTGANVSWDVSGVQPGTYTITAGVDDGCGVCGKTQTQTITIKECPDCQRTCSCPTLGVTGPAGITNPGDMMTFTANVSGGTQDNITYNWTVSAGTIESGQGTPSITVRAPSDGTTNIIATVELGGLSPSCNCPNTASETGGIAPKPKFNQVDEFGKATDDEVKARVDQFYIQLNNNPNAQGYIINYGTPAEIKRRRAQITKAINFRKYDASRVTFVDGPDNGTGANTKFYLVPPGAENPTP